MQTNTRGYSYMIPFIALKLDKSLALNQLIGNLAGPIRNRE